MKNGRGIWVGASILALLVALPVAAGASSLFQDVGDDNVFSTDIEWMATQGITTGCNPPTNDRFCPDDPVTRAQMAAFMRRLSNQTSSSAAWAANSESARVGANARTVTHVGGVNAPGGGGALVISGLLTVLEDAEVNAGVVWIEVDGGGSCSGAGWGFAVWDTIAIGTDSVTAATVWDVPAGSHRVDLCAQGVASGAVDAFGELSVQWVPQLNSAGFQLAASEAGTLDALLDRIEQRLEG